LAHAGYKTCRAKNQDTLPSSRALIGDVADLIAQGKRLTRKQLDHLRMALARHDNRKRSDLYDLVVQLKNGDGGSNHQEDLSQRRESVSHDPIAETTGREQVQLVKEVANLMEAIEGLERGLGMPQGEHLAEAKHCLAGEFQSLGEPLPQSLQPRHAGVIYLEDRRSHPPYDS